MGLMEYVKSQAFPILDKLLRDDELKESVTYQKFSESSFNDSLGHNVDIFKDFLIDGIKSFHTKKSEMIGNSKIQEGDELYIFKSDDFPSGSSLKDQIIGSDGSVYKVKSILPVAEICVIVTVDGG